MRVCRLVAHGLPVGSCNAFGCALIVGCRKRVQPVASGQENEQNAQWGKTWERHAAATCGMFRWSRVAVQVFGFGIYNDSKRVCLNEIDWL